MKYCDFYDVPRLVAVTHDDALFLLDCPYDDETEDYPAYHEVYRLPPRRLDELAGASWEGLAASGRRVGRIPVDAVEFDPSRRSSVNANLFDRLETQ